jgi:nitroimidazol reductase NimA-like FMN-containing flavoprotein (pyridoxamine 5'-phosphate oxidase superfamily)
LVSKKEILANPVEICFGSFLATSTVLVVATSSATAVKVLATPVVVPVSDLVSKTHSPKPYDIFQGMERVIDMMEETLQICERAQRSTQTVSHHKTFSFSLQPSSDIYTRQVTKSS